MITQQIKLNLIPGQVFPRVNASQYDSGTRTLQMALYNGDQVFNIASGMTAVVQGTKPDRTGFQYAATVTAGSNIVTIDITQQMTAVKGDVTCELVISNGNNRIATVNFILYVEAAALADDTVISETDLPLIEEAAELAERIDGIVQQIDEDAQTASDAADKAEAYGTHPPYIGANGNWFVYNVTTQQYEDSGVEAQGPLSGLTDVEISNLAENDIIAYDATAQKWKNSSEFETLTNQVKDMNNMLGAKNLLPYPYYENRASISDITYVKNSDGSVTFNGTATATAYFNCTYTNKIVDFGNVNFNSKSSSDAPYIATLENGSDNVYLAYNGTNKITSITISSGTVCNNLTVYPMIRLASITDDTYEPYAKTNQELTEETASIESDISAINTQLSQLDFDGAGAHNSIYRGKYLGAEVTAEQYTHISDGTFKDMYIGDYWTIGGVNYRIGAFDYWLRTGNTECTEHHVLLVPDTNLASGKMNDTNTTTGGYVGSDLKTGNNSNTALATAKSTINNAFGSAHILTHREYFTNAVANGKPSAGAWYDSDIDLMNENMVYGTNIFLPHPDGSTIPTLSTIDKTQIKLFTDRPDLITNRADWWLRDVVSAADFANVNSVGNAAFLRASSSFGVRPAFAIKA